VLKRLLEWALGHPAYALGAGIVIFGVVTLGDERLDDIDRAAIFGLALSFALFGFARTVRDFEGANVGRLVFRLALVAFGVSAILFLASL
jgi:hypothetical protein